MDHYRGMKKWRPFASMPEQYIGLKEIINKQVYLTYYKNGQCITEKGFIQFVDSLGDFFIFIDEVFELKNKMRLSELIDIRFL